MDLEATAQYEYLDYDTNEDLQGFRSGFTSPSVDMQLVRKMTERFQLGVGPYYSRYERDDNSNESDSYGGLINLRWQTSEITRSSLLLRVEQNKDVILEPVRVEDKSTAWGLEWVGVRQHRLGQTQYRIGRFLQATSLGGRRKVDQAHVQYDRPLSQRTLLRGAVRYMRANDISDLETSDGDERDQARFDLMVRHFFTENFFVSGQYRFAWVDRNASGNAENHAVFLSLGLRKRDPTGGFRE
jgi:hypothetical protein